MLLFQAGPVEAGAVLLVDAPSQSGRTSGYEDATSDGVAAANVGPTGSPHTAAWTCDRSVPYSTGQLNTVSADVQTGLRRTMRRAETLRCARLTPQRSGTAPQTRSWT